MSTPEGIDIALRKGFHIIGAYEMSRECRKLLDARPTCEFAGLKPGKTYIYKPSYGDGMRLLTIGEVTPKRTQAIASVNRDAPRRIYKGDYTGTFSELDADLIALADVKHETIVAAAVGTGLDVPPPVRREYPGLFVEIPERFAQPPNISATERVANAFSPAWVQRDKAMTPAILDAQIEEAHQQIARLQDTRCQAIAGNPDTATDYDRYIADYQTDIDFYRWLRRLVDVGGVFYVEEQP